MKIVKSILNNLISQQPKTLLGRWRFVGAQKNDTDILTLKMVNKKNRQIKLQELRNNKNYVYN